RGLVARWRACTRPLRRGRAADGSVRGCGAPEREPGRNGQGAPARWSKRDAMSHDRKDKKKGGLGRKVMMLLVLCAAAVGVAWYFDPEMVRSKVALLTGMLGGRGRSGGR